MIRFLIGLALCGPMAAVMQHSTTSTTPPALVGVAVVLATIGGWIMTRSVEFAFIVGGLSFALFCVVLVNGHL